MNATESKPVSTDATDEESRLEPRVTVERPGRLQIRGVDGKSFTIPVGVVDISANGCRVIVQGDKLPPDWRWESGLPAALTSELEPGTELTFPLHLVWSQRTHTDFSILGFRFAGFASESAKDLDRFVMLRMRVGLELKNVVSDSADMQSLPVALPVDSRSSSAQASEPAAFRLHLLDMGSSRARLEARPRHGEQAHVPKVGEFLDISVHAPAWAGVETRTLRFAARVTDVKDKNVEIEFASDGHDLQQMVHELLPAEQIQRKGPARTEMIYIYILLLIFIIYFVSRL